ncbi:hypothetical protein FB45DRAFT_1035054 [Roridomyces roridus]|uniref:Uncharacterized protein n=1 Tax=Roridomyces roridus TaxID=1738132 RepID=A0AAD7BB69_9AGAR|nr:hypothetical protein FB45DRAFT_1035054 [Roridomyces roridus]
MTRIPNTLLGRFPVSCNTNLPDDVLSLVLARSWPLHKDDTLFRSGRPMGLNIYAFFNTQTLRGGPKKRFAVFRSDISQMILRRTVSSELL